MSKNIINNNNNKENFDNNINNELINTINKEIQNLENEIGNEKKFKEIDLIKNEINKFFNNNKFLNNENDYDIDNLKNKLKFINEIDIIKQSNNIKIVLTSIHNIFINITNNYSFKEKVYNEIIIKKFQKEIENLLLKIKFPIFEGQILLNIFDKIQNENGETILIIKKYFLILNELYKEYSEECNKGILNNNKKNENIEIIYEFLFKRIISSILINNNNNVNNNKNILKEKLIETFDTLIIYLNKTFINLSELLSIFSSRDEYFKINKNIIIKKISNNLFYKLSLYFISNELYHINNLNFIDQMFIIQKICDFHLNFRKIFNYDTLKLSSLFDYLKEILNENLFIENQSLFSNFVVDSINKKINEEKENKTYVIENIIDMINMLFQDNFNIFLIFRNYEILDNLINKSYKNLINIFRNLYNKETKIFNFSRTELIIEKNLYVMNLLFTFQNDYIIKFSNLFEMIDLFEDDFKEKFYNNHKKNLKDINELIESFSKLIIKYLECDKIINLFKVGNLISNDQNKINNEFKIINNNLNNFSKSLDSVKISKNLSNYLYKNLFENIIKNLITEIQNSLKEKARSKEIEFLSDKIHFLINNLINKANVIEGNEKNVQTVFSLIGNLIMNKI